MPDSVLWKRVVEYRHQEIYDNPELYAWLETVYEAFEKEFNLPYLQNIDSWKKISNVTTVYLDRIKTVLIQTTDKTMASLPIPNFWEFV